ncbi:hypothetical protein AA313_de0207028 [Arthrobotrys entomopaga]|nr:hypothetical protein AA313_de0207028 [Arthrobotrys entomopaga]
MKFSRLVTFRGDFIGDAEDDDFGDEQPEDARWESVDSNSTDEDAWEASGSEDEGGDWDSNRLTKNGILQDFDEEEFTPKPRTCNFTKITLYRASTGAHTLSLHKIISASKRLTYLKTSCTGPREVDYFGDNQPVAESILSQADTLKELELDRSVWQCRALIRNLKNLENLDMPLPNHVDQLRPLVEATLNNWLPSSLKYLPSFFYDVRVVLAQGTM